MPSNTRGDISIYIVIVVGMMILGSAVLLGIILARQITLTEDLVASERAFYAASAGTERGFYDLALAIKAQGNVDIAQPDVTGTVDYEINGVTETATYTANISQRGGRVCGSSTGRFAGEQRRIQIGPTGC